MQRRTTVMRHVCARESCAAVDGTAIYRRYGDYESFCWFISRFLSPGEMTVNGKQRRRRRRRQEGYVRWPDECRTQERPTQRVGSWRARWGDRRDVFIIERDRWLPRRKQCATVGGGDGGSGGGNRREHRRSHTCTMCCALIINIAHTRRTDDGDGAFLPHAFGGLGGVYI